MPKGPKMKTRKAAVKRFKLTGTGKLKRKNSFQNHKMMHKSGSEQRRLDLGTVHESGGQSASVRKMLQVGPVQ